MDMFDYTGKIKINLKKRGLDLMKKYSLFFNVKTECEGFITWSRREQKSMINFVPDNILKGIKYI